MQTVINYHQETKHQPMRSARSLGYMDWENQPNPFRSYRGARKIDLPLMESVGNESFDQLFFPSLDKKKLSITGVARLLELSLGLSAWKSIGREAWTLRMNPSSGNLHPTEAHLILPQLGSSDSGSGLEAGVYHYDPYEHGLKRRRVFPRPLAESLFASFKGAGFFMLLSTIYWRESWKYGERAFRYCQHDIGHAIAGVAFAAALNGWRTGLVNGLGQSQLDRLAGFDKIEWPPLEAEASCALLYIHDADGNEAPEFPDDLIEDIGKLDIIGEPNALSPTRVDWPIITDVARATEKPVTETVQFDLSEAPLHYSGAGSLNAEDVIRRRRSAQAFDRSGTMHADVFYDILDRTLPRAGAAPFDVHLQKPSVHLFCFVHGVEGLAPGLYAFIRNEAEKEELVKNLSSSFAWTKAHNTLPLYMLGKGDVRALAADVSCRQDIAGESCFSLGMVGRFESRVKKDPFVYPRIFWEAGMIGQSLYLTAESHGFRGTGIGCYFDDTVHDFLGIESSEFQSFYHFTIGKPLTDSRLTTRPPYSHLKSPRN